MGYRVMPSKEQVAQALEGLSEEELEQVAQYLAYLRIRSRVHTLPPFDLDQAATLYAEFGVEDRLLAEEGMAEYHEGLRTEDGL
jgi:hypothetical protein